MSYMWNSSLAVLTTVVVGLVVSFITGIYLYYIPPPFVVLSNIYVF